MSRGGSPWRRASVSARLALRAVRTRRRHAVHRLVAARALLKIRWWQSRAAFGPVVEYAKSASLTLTAVVAVWAAYSWFGVSAFVGEGARDVLLAVGGTVATVLTLAFTLFAIALQRASEDYSPGLLRSFVADKGVRRIFAGISVVALTAFGLAAASRSNQHDHWAAALGIVAVALTLDGLRWLYLHVTRALEPVVAIRYMLNGALLEIGRAEAVARTVQRAIAMRPLSPSERRAASAAAFRQVPAFRESLLRWSEYFAEDAVRAMGRHQTGVALQAVRCLAEITGRPLIARRDDALFFADPSDFLNVSSDVSEPLQRMYETLERIGFQAISAGNERVAVAVVRALLAQCQLAAKVRDDRASGRARLTFAPLYIAEQLLAAARKAKAREVVYQGTSAVAEFAVAIAPTLRVEEFLKNACDQVESSALHFARDGDLALANSLVSRLGPVLEACACVGDPADDDRFAHVFAVGLNVFKALHGQGSVEASQSGYGLGGLLGSPDWLEQTLRTLIARCENGDSAARGVALRTFSKLVAVYSGFSSELLKLGAAANAVTLTQLSFGTVMLAEVGAVLVTVPAVAGDSVAVAHLQRATQLIPYAYSWALPNEIEAVHGDIHSVGGQLVEIAAAFLSTPLVDVATLCAFTCCSLSKRCTDRQATRGAAELLAYAWLIEDALRRKGRNGSADEIRSLREQRLAEADAAVEQGARAIYDEETQEMMAVLDGRANARISDRPLYAIAKSLDLRLRGPFG
jgi:hypothetical protein